MNPGDKVGVALIGIGNWSGVIANAVQRRCNNGFL